MTVENVQVKDEEDSVDTRQQVLDGTKSLSCENDSKSDSVTSSTFGNFPKEMKVSDFFLSKPPSNLESLKLH